MKLFLTRTQIVATTGLLSLAVVAGLARQSGGEPPTSVPAAPATAPASAPASAPSGPPVHVVAKGELTFEARADAVFVPIEPFEVKTNFKAYAGPLVVTSVAAPGTLIRKDQPIIAFDRTWIDWQLSATESELAAAKANLVKVEAEVKLAVLGEQLLLRQTEEALKNVEAGKKWFEDVDGPQMLLGADFAVKSAQNAVDDQNDELDQLRKMYQGEELTAATADIVVRRAVRTLEQSRIVLKMQQERREKLKSLDYPAARQRVIDTIDATRQQLAAIKVQQDQAAVLRAGGLIAAKTALEQVVRKLSDAKEDAAQFQIRAPAEGVLAYGNLVDGVWSGGDPKLFKLGEKVPPGQVLMRVYQPGKLRLMVNLPESQAYWVEQGMKARVTPASMPQTSYEVQSSGVEVQSRMNPPGIAWIVTLDINNADARLVPGMRASVLIDAGKLADVLLIPLNTAAGGKVRVKQKDGAIVEKSVKLGKTDGQNVEVKSGLGEGDEVVKK